MPTLLVVLGFWILQDPGELRPGLAAEYRAGDRVLSRIDAKPAFAWGLSSPHPRLPEGPFEAVWSGFLHLVEADAVSFDSDVDGDLTLEVAGRAALPGPLELDAGFHPLRIAYRSPAGRPARLKLHWSGRTFSREPLPPWRLRHDPRTLPPAFARDALVERGRLEAARLGCASCHSAALPGLDEPPIGPSLAGLGARMGFDRLVDWLDAPRTHKPGARMPALFAPGPAGLDERRAVARLLLGDGAPPPGPTPAANDRLGKRHFQSLGCVACHLVPDEPADEQERLGRFPLENLPFRRRPAELAAFLLDPAARYPDGRMPRLVKDPKEAADLAAYLLLGAPAETPPEPPPGPLGDGLALLKQKRCASCHAGIEETAVPEPVPLAAPGADCRLARFPVDDAARADLEAYLGDAAGEGRPSAFWRDQRLLGHLGCLRCHSRDDDRPPVLEQAGSLLGGAYLQRVPFQRTPRLPYVHDKYLTEHLERVLRDGGRGERGREYTYRMPAFGGLAPRIRRALAAGDGDLPERPDEEAAVQDPTLAPLGPGLVGFEGYSCISCHVWKGVLLTETDPGALGPELTSAAGRIRRTWFDRWLEDPARIHPGTPMPQIFKKDRPATLAGVLDGDAAKQRDALWGYLSLGKDAPSPRPLPPLELAGPRVAQIPVRLPGDVQVEALCWLTPTHDLLVFDVGRGDLRAAYTGARLLRKIRGRLRTFVAEGAPLEVPAQDPGPFAGYELLKDGLRILGGSAWVLEGRTLLRDGSAFLRLPAPATPPTTERPTLPADGPVEGSLERPGYRAIAYARPKLESGADLIMPGAVAVDPLSGRVFVASMKTGGLYAVEGEGAEARFVDYTGGLFQEAFSMLAERDALYVLHRRNLTRIRDLDGDGRADRFERVAALPHGIGETYDYAYGLARDASGAFVLSYAPYANRKLPGSGGLLRLVPGGVEELAYGFRNPLGWARGPEGGIFFTDNQGEWVATSKLGHIEPGRYYGFPNPEQKEHAKRPPGPACVWVPYAWARSINGLAWCDTGGRFGPFEGQIFLAELMYGGAIVRADVERVNGVMQGACFPFWGKGLLGPLTLAFDPKGPLYVGSITEPGWMAQPDRGALYRIDWTGEVPFELRTIRARPDGFRLRFTRPPERRTASDPASYAAWHYRYEHTGAYGSPELDRTAAPVSAAALSEDGLEADLRLPPLVKGRVYRISAPGVRDPSGRPLLHPEGAYTLNEIPE